MSELVVWINELKQETPWLATLLALFALVLAAAIANLITKKILVRGLLSLLQPKNAEKPRARSGEFKRYGFIRRLANVVPALVITFGIR